MSVEFNHTIVWSRDSKASAAFLAGMLGLLAPKKWGGQVVTTANGVNVDFMDKEGKIRTQLDDVQNLSRNFLRGWWPHGSGRLVVFEAIEPTEKEATNERG
jgi:hypothetical protein